MHLIMPMSLVGFLVSCSNGKKRTYHKEDRLGHQSLVYQPRTGLLRSVYTLTQDVSMIGGFVAVEGPYASNLPCRYLLVLLVEPAIFSAFWLINIKQ
jgi:hypothetical protein